jgi:hypothetical protein
LVVVFDERDRAERIHKLLPVPLGDHP